MLKGQKSKRNGIQDVLCPFTDWYCTQGANDLYSHSGSEANDIRGIQAGVRYPYYAPVDVRCVNINRQYAFVWWQSFEKVRLADGSVDYITFLCGHDNIIDCYVGQVIKQGIQIGNMGNAGRADGVHCHIEVGRGKQKTWISNEYNVYCIPNQIPLEKAFFMDNTNIMLGVADWKYLNDVKVETSDISDKYLNLNSDIDSWNVYPMDIAPIDGNQCAKLNPSKFGGVSYTIQGYSKKNVAIINTRDFGLVQIYIGPETKGKYSITDSPKYGLVK